MVANGYKALNLGGGLNSPWGGLSLDITHSESDTKKGDRVRGQSARVLYSNTLSSTNTTFTMVGYRYSTDGYRTLSQHVDEQDAFVSTDYGRQRSRIDMNINQSLYNRGSLFLSVGETSYWNRKDATRRWQFGYSSNYRDASYSVAVARTEGQGNSRKADNQMTVSISLPFGSPSRSQRVYTNVVSSNTGDSSIRSGVSGSLDEQNNVNYSVQVGHSKKGGSTGDFGLNWDAPVAKVNGNYGQGPSDKHFDLGASGSVVVHSGGVTFGQPIGETFSLIEVQGAKDVGIDSSTSVRTDGRGYAVVPYTQPYRYNWINLDSNTLGSDRDIEDSSQLVVPTRGAIVKTNFKVSSGRRLQLVLRAAGGQRIPFGAQAFDEKGAVVGVVDNLSRLLIFVTEDKSSIGVRWGDKKCNVNYEMPPANNESAYDQIEAACI